MSFTGNHHYFFYVTGGFSNPEVVLWNSQTLQLLSNVRVSGPVHEAAFSPSTFSQLACVGDQGVYFCLLHTHGQDVELNVNTVNTKYKPMYLCSTVKTSHELYVLLKSKYFPPYTFFNPHLPV